MIKRNFVAGFASGLLLAFLAAVVATGIWIWTRPVERAGGGRHLDSPNTRYKAEAWNMSEQNISGGERNFYSFRVTDNDTGFEISRHEVPMPKDPVWFRGGPGGIYWDVDSLIVRFGTSTQAIWTYAINPPEP